LQILVALKLSSKKVAAHVAPLVQLATLRQASISAVFSPGRRQPPALLDHVEM